MHLTRVVIKNFRSIADATIRFDLRCRVLVGINESGKTNVLKALALLSDDIKPTVHDIRNPSKESEAIEDSSVYFVFTLDQSDQNEIVAHLKRQTYCNNWNTPLTDEDTNATTLEKYVREIKEYLYFVDIQDEKKYPIGWQIDDLNVNENWLVPKAGVSELISGTTKSISSFRLIERSSLKPEQINHCRAMDVKLLYSTVSSIVSSYVKERLPQCVYWSYSDQQLLPPNVEIETFSANPEKFDALRQMFLLAGYSDIPKAFEDAKKRPTGLRNLLRRVSESATNHLRRVWKEYKSIRILLEPNAESIDVNIEDSYNLYDFSRRSDGFKRFITFLFLISAKTKNGQLKNALYLHDEPDSGLHPSGTKHLLQELIKVAKENYVVLSTHSVFMIDRDQVERHIIVAKKDERTSLQQADTSNFQDEEVLYQALGFSVFEMLAQDNLIFEGWRDKRLLEIAISSSSEKAREVRKKLKSIGLSHLQGVKEAPRVSTVLELARRNWIVISDGDARAIEAQRQSAWKTRWFRYDELSPDRINTGEDWIKSEKVVDVVNELCDEYGLSWPVGEDLNEMAKLMSVRATLSRLGLDPEKVGQVIDKLKQNLIDSIKPSDIRESYLEMIENAIGKLQELKTETSASADS